MSIRMKLFMSFIGFIVLIVVLSGIFSYTMHINRKMLFESLKLQKNLFDNTTIYNHYSDLQRRLLLYFLIPEVRTEKSVQDKIKELEKEGMDITKIRRSFNDLVRLWKGCSSSFYSRSDALISEIDKILSRLKKEKEECEKRLNNSKLMVSRLATNSFYIAGFISLSSVIIMFIISMVLYILIIKPLKMFETASRIVGSGDLTYKLNLKSKDEFGKLANVFNEMIENIKNLQVQVVSMDRMVSIGQLAGGVAHEINNPLTGVIGQAQILLTKLPKDFPYYENIVKIERAAQRCRRIVKALLDFAREKSYVFQPVNVNLLIEETFELCISDLIASKINVVKKYSSIPEVKMSPFHIQQVFINLITNAMQAMPDGGILYISTYRDGNYVKISFKDTGVGILKEHMDKLFTPFFTTKEIGKGIGLGLAVSYGIIQKHNGKIEAKSEGAGKGAEFIVSLPV